MKRAVLSLLAVLSAADASAEPGFARLFRGRYGYEPSCSACHSEGGGSSLGAYGEAFKKAGKTAAALATIEPADSDGDGAANLAEIKAKSDPGSPKSTPEAKGDWLDPANLIPAEVQKAFPGVRTYKPLDAIFTAKEIERAKALGVTLGEADETTIYVPFDGGQAAGAAVIVPAAHDDKQSFLVVAADRNLNLRSVAPIGSKDTLAGSKVYPLFVGKHVDQIEIPGGLSPADAAAAASIKKAATILYVRLTKGVDK